MSMVVRHCWTHLLDMTVRAEVALQAVVAIICYNAATLGSSLLALPCLAMCHPVLEVHRLGSMSCSLNANSCGSDKVHCRSCINDLDRSHHQLSPFGSVRRKSRGIVALCIRCSRLGFKSARLMIKLWHLGASSVPKFRVQCASRTFPCSCPGSLKSLASASHAAHLLN